MKKMYIGAILVLVAACLLWYLQFILTAEPITATVATSSVATTTAEDNSMSQDLGTYPYECDEHVTFSMTPSLSMDTIALVPLRGTYPATSTLTTTHATSGVEYVGNGMTFIGKGESVVLVSTGSAPLNCSPVQDPNNAPFNFGD